MKVLDDALYTAPQLRYFAHWLTRRGPAETTLLSAAAQSRVDLNPHQIEAALFALRGTDRASAFAKGVLLADEVGLGKTIEAGLVLAQHWAAKKRRLLLVVPASLRKQWQLELDDKFSLAATVLDAQSAKGTVGNPFQRESIVIVGYEFAAIRHQEIAAIDWDLVVFDEAHRLRSLHRDGKRAIIYYAYAEGTVEEKIAAVVLARMTAMDGMAGDDTSMLEEIERTVALLAAAALPLATTTAGTRVIATHSVSPHDGD